MRSRSLALDAASAVFLQSGYHGATLERVAAEAGLAKRTIYNLFPDKDALFEATVLRAIAIAAEFTGSLTDLIRREGVTADDLVSVGVRLAEATLLGPATALRRLVIMESVRFPELVVAYRAGAPESVMSALAEVLGRLAEEGRLRGLDPRIAAEHFAFLVMGADLDRGTFTGERPSRARTRRRARLGAEAFVRAYRP